MILDRASLGLSTALVIASLWNEGARWLDEVCTFLRGQTSILKNIHFRCLRPGCPFSDRLSFYVSHNDFITLYCNCFTCLSTSVSTMSQRQLAAVFSMPAYGEYSLIEYSLINTRE